MERIRDERGNKIIDGEREREREKRERRMGELRQTDRLGDGWMVVGTWELEM